MKFFHNLFYVLACLFISALCLYSQNCIDYGTFDEPPCGSCAPSGWTAGNFGPEIDPPNTGCTGQGASPTGGTFVALQSNTGVDEFIYTTINGLTPGSSYTLLFWYMSETCGGGVICCGPLHVTVDGVLYEFPAEDTWTLAEMCIVAEGSSMDIELASALGSANQSWLFIDDAECSDAEEECCELKLELEDDEILCPEELFQIEAFIDGSEGPLEITWECDPDEGLDYLSDLTVIDPEFYFPNTDPGFNGASFNYTLIVSDDNCQVQDEIEITLKPVILPEFVFALRYCETDGEIPLPLTSDNGFTGNWQTPEINTTDWPGQTVSNVFIPDPGQEDCPFEVEYEFEIQAYVVPEFDFPVFWCRSEFDSFEFPEESINGVEGRWDLEELVPEDHNDGILVLEFTPDDPFCTETIEIVIELSSGDSLNFYLPDNYCTEDGIIELPDESDENIQGIWTTPILDLSQMNGMQSIQFLPMDEDCYAPYTYNFSVTNSLAVSFDTIDPICRTNGIVTLDSFSLEGYQGYWSQQIFDPDTIGTTMFYSTWYPLPDQANCLNDTTVEFLITDAIVPDFDLPGSLCLNDELFIFPEFSSDPNISGQWSIESIDPAVSGITTIQSVFTPSDSLCAREFVWDIEIVDLIVPEFTVPLSMCESDSAIELASISNNSISGNWSIDIIDPSGMGGQTIESLFTPDQGNSCASSITVQIDIEVEDIPEFSLPSYLCWSDDDLVLETVSDNGIIGSWTDPVIRIEDHLGSDLVIEFSADSGQCSEGYITEIHIVDVYGLDIISTDPSSCGLANGKLELTGILDDLEFSIDNGNSWQESNCFEDLMEGNYIILIRSVIYPDCILERTEELMAPGLPEVNSVEITNVSSCDGEDGIITIEAVGLDLEYSIDGGVSWSSDNTFLNLPAGTYTVYVRAATNDDCIVELDAMIGEFPQTTLISVSSTDPSDCNEFDGLIELVAEGRNLEYSIDNGMSWTDDPVFRDLPAGSYDLIVRSKDDPDCSDSSVLELNDPDLPVIVNIDRVDPGSCDPDTGSIRIDSNDPDIEYSIDGGMSWSAANSFTDLTAGNYEVLIRSINYPACIDSEIVELIELTETLTDIDFQLVPPSDCMSNDAQIILITADPNIEYSLDQANTWHSGSIIDNLSPGSYELYVRHSINTDCQTSIELQIDDVDCPCSDLIIDYSVTPMYCVDEANGSIEILSISGNMDNDIVIEWDNASSELFLEGLFGGWYAFTIHYDNDCEWRDSVFVEQIDPLEFALTTYDPNCPGSADGSIEVTEISGGNGNYSYSINGVDYQSSNVFVDLDASEYQVFVLDDQNCLQSQFVELISDDGIEIDLPQIMTIEQGQTVFLNPLINEMTIDSFLWDYDPSILNPGELIAEIQPEETTVYTLSIFYGLCIEVRIITVELIETTDIYIPNIFTPRSSDGNSVLFIQSDQDANLNIQSLRIYDRWGNLMFDNRDLPVNDPSAGWDGYYNDYRVQSGVYVYVVDYLVGNELKQKIGSITIL